MNLINLMSVLKDYMLGLSFPEIPFEVGMGAFVGFIGFWVLLQFINKPLSEEERVMYFRKLRKIRNSKLRKIKTKDSKIEFKQEIVGVETSDFKYVSERPKSNMKKCKVSLSAGMIQASQQQDWEEYSCSSVDTSTLSIDNGANDDRLRGSSSDDYASSAVYTRGEEDETEGLLDEDNTVKKLSRFQKMGVSEEMLREEIRKVNELKSQGVSLDDIAELQKSDLQQVNLIKAFDWVLFIGLIIMGAWAANEMSDGDAGRVLAAMFPKETTALGLKDFLEGYSSRTNTGSAESAGGVVRRE